MKKNKRMINDRAFRFLATEFSEEFHKNLNLPGKFKSILQNDVITGKQDNLRMDLLEEVEADGERIKERTMLNIEHQSTKLTLEKMKKITEYVLYSECRYNVPIVALIVTPFKKEAQENMYKRSLSKFTKPLFIVIDEAEINKRLNNLETKIKYNNVEDYELLDFAIIPIFAQKNQEQILEKLCHLYQKLDQMENEIKTKISVILESMINKHVRSKEKQKELMEMIEKDLTKAKNGMQILFEEEFDEINEKHAKELAEKDKNHAQELAEKDKTIDRIIIQKDADMDKIIELKDRTIDTINKNHTQELAEKDEALNAKDIIIAQLNAKLQKFENTQTTPNTI